MEIYRIVNRETDEEVGVYMPPTARDEYNFSSISEARHSNCHGIYEDKVDYKIRKYKLVLVEDDCDPPTEEDRKKKEEQERIHSEAIQCQEKIALEKFNKQISELSLIEYVGVIDCFIKCKTAEIEEQILEQAAELETDYDVDITDCIVNCSTCNNNVEFPPPHTCDICTSLDQDEEYSMWEAKE